MSDSTTWSLRTPPGTPGAVAIFSLDAGSAEGLERTLRALGLAPPTVGEVAVREFLGVDRGVVIRWTDRCAHLMPHGGPAVVRALAAGLERAGVRACGGGSPLDEYPEARSEVEARMLAALARAASPLAVELLLDQPRRWAGAAPEGAPSDPANDRARNRLIDPPTVVAAGPPNVGKSTLVNALAGRAVAVVADEPGTTRDHVGVRLDLAGLVVNYIDTPGLRAAADEAEAGAQEGARAVIAAADLVILCGDATAPPPVLGASGVAARPDASVLRLATRTDLGAPGWAHDVAVRRERGAWSGLSGLVAAVRERLVPEGALADPRPWRFWA